MKQSNISKPTLKFSEKASVSNVNVLNVNVSMIIFVCLKLAPSIRGKIRLGQLQNRYYTNNTQESLSFTKQSFKVCIAHCSHT